MWWLKTRRAHLMIPVAWASYAALLLIVRDNIVALPSMIGASSVVLSLFVPVPVFALLMNCLESRLDFAEAAGTRNVGALDAALSLAAVLGAWILGSAVDSVTKFTGVTSVGRNTFFLVGLMLCARPICKKYSVMIPVAWLFCVVFLGFDNSREPRSWTIILEPIGNWVSAIVSLVIFILGLVVQMRSSRRIS